MMEQRAKIPQKNGSNYYPQKTVDELVREIKEIDFISSFDSILKMSVCDDLDKLLVDTETFIKKKGKNVSASQLRNIYDKIIKAKTINQLKMIRPHLAYAAARNTSESKPFFGFIDMLIKDVKGENQLKEFKSFMESIVAYHKLYSDKK